MCGSTINPDKKKTMEKMFISLFCICVDEKIIKWLVVKSRMFPHRNIHKYT